MADGTLPRRPVLPAERLPDPAAAAARAARGHPVAGLVLHPPASARAAAARITQVPRGGDGRAAAARLARQRPRARERHRARDDPLDRRHAACSTKAFARIRRRDGRCRHATRTRWTPCSGRTSRRVLRQCGWRINGAGNAAERLGLHPNTLRFRMKKLGIVCPDRPRGQMFQGEIRAGGRIQLTSGERQTVMGSRPAIAVRDRVTIGIRYRAMIAVARRWRRVRMPDRPARDTVPPDARLRQEFGRCVVVRACSSVRRCTAGRHRCRAGQAFPLDVGVYHRRRRWRRSECGGDPARRLAPGLRTARVAHALIECLIALSTASVCRCGTDRLASGRRARKTARRRR